jgi:hypothetical protein
VDFAYRKSQKNYDLLKCWALYIYVRLLEPYIVTWAKSIQKEIWPSDGIELEQLRFPLGGWHWSGIRRAIPAHLGSDAMSKMRRCCISDTVVFRGWEPQSFSHVVNVMYSMQYVFPTDYRFHEAIIHSSWAHLYEKTMTTTVEGAFADDRLGTAQSSIGWVSSSIGWVPMFAWPNPHALRLLPVCVGWVLSFFPVKSIKLQIPNVWRYNVYDRLCIYIYIIIYIHSIH